MFPTANNSYRTNNQGGGRVEALLLPVTFFIIPWLLFILAVGDISQIFNLAKYLYKIMFPISCLMCVYEAIRTGKWLVFKNFTTITLFVNLFFMFILLVFWFIFKNLKVTINTDAIDYKYGIITCGISTQHRIMMFLSFSIVFNPIINISCIVQLIRNYIL
jgi:hypothetical protein